MIDGNRLAFAREGLLAPGAVRVVHQTAPYDHCNMTVLDDGHPATARFVEVLQAMSYDDPVVRPLLDLEGLTRWLPGRTSGYAALERAVTRDGSLAAWLATMPGARAVRFEDSGVVEAVAEAHHHQGVVPRRDGGSHLGLTASRPRGRSASGS